MWYNYGCYIQNKHNIIIGWYSKIVTSAFFLKILQNPRVSKSSFWETMSLCFCTAHCYLVLTSIAVKSTPSVDFIIFESFAFFIELALTIYSLHLCPTFAPLKATQKLGPTVYPIPPILMKFNPSPFLNK